MDRTCAFCQCQIGLGELAVPTTVGDHVHVVCADRDAAAAFARRQTLALIQGAYLLGMSALLLSLAGPTPWLLAHILFWAVLHLAVHWHWWRMVVRNGGRWQTER